VAYVDPVPIRSHIVFLGFSSMPSSVSTTSSLVPSSILNFLRR